MLLCSEELSGFVEKSQEAAILGGAVLQMINNEHDDEGCFTDSGRDHSLPPCNTEPVIYTY